MQERPSALIQYAVEMLARVKSLLDYGRPLKDVLATQSEQGSPGVIYPILQPMLFLYRASRLVKARSASGGLYVGEPSGCLGISRTVQPWKVPS
jgi:hypothetical protein